MAGTKIGGQKAAAKNLAKNPNFYSEIGAKGGKNSTSGGFASDKIGKDGLSGFKRAAVAGKKGGKKSRRGYITKPAKIRSW